LIEGPHLIVERSANLSWVGVGALCYIVYPTTLVGFSLWSWLLSRYSAGTVAPISLLVPIIGFASSAVVLGEPIQWWKVMAAILICSGLLINIFGGRIGLFQRLALATAASSQKG
jgi:O-acetylserine/cysteine efflux transporter